MTTVLALVALLAITYVAGYLTAWLLLHHRVARLANLAARMQADVADLRDRDRHAAQHDPRRPPTGRLRSDGMTRRRSWGLALAIGLACWATAAPDLDRSYLVSDTKTTAIQLTDLEALQQAAVLIRHRASLAADSPWKAAPVWSPDSTSTSAVYSHAHPTGTVASEVIASGRIRPGYGGIRNPHNAVHIAAFADPAVAFAVADLLDDEAHAAKVFNGGKVYATRTLAIARAYLAGEPR